VSIANDQRDGARARADVSQLVLRAEIRIGDAAAVACALRLTESSVFVATEAVAAVGATVELRLSFPRLLAPVELRATVEEVRAAGGPGEPSGLRLRFEPHPAITALLARLRDTIAARRARRAYRVLLVEDNGFIREVFDYRLGTFFADPGAYVVHHAETAELAWTRLTEGDYDLVIVDFYLPTENGAALIERVRGDARFADTPIVAISVGGRDAREASIAAGADLFLDKPLVFRDLFSTLGALADSDATARDVPEIASP